MVVLSFRYARVPLRNLQGHKAYAYQNHSKFICDANGAGLPTRFKISKSASPIAEDFFSEPNCEFGCRFLEPKPVLPSNGEGERETFSESPVQVIWGRGGIVTLVLLAHDELEFIVGAIPQALAQGIAYALGR